MNAKETDQQACNINAVGGLRNAEATALPHSRTHNGPGLGWQRAGTWRTKSGHIRSGQGLEARPKRTRGGHTDKADTRRTRRAHGGQMAGKVSNRGAHKADNGGKAQGLRRVLRKKHLHKYISSTSSHLHIYIFTSSHLHIYIFTTRSSFNSFLRRGWCRRSTTKVNPPRRSCVSKARNAGEIAFWICRAQPSEEIARVEFQVRLRFCPVQRNPLRRSRMLKARKAGEIAFFCPVQCNPLRRLCWFTARNAG